MHDLATSLRGAVVRGEISAWFQPQIDLISGRVVGAEALCRWQHPELGHVPPIEFIAIAETADLIDEIGRFMTVECCRALGEWSTTDAPLDVSVNVSPLQLRTAAFTEWLEVQLLRLQLEGHTLTIEITESQPIHDLPSVVRRLDRLRALGLGIAIDDFGTGQASLSQLRRLHGTELKIDRSLVIDASSSSTATIAEAVRVAHADGIVVVAEGVETEQHLARVTELGCDRAQGYHFARPMPWDEMAAYLAR